MKELKIVLADSVAAALETHAREYDHDQKLVMTAALLAYTAAHPKRKAALIQVARAVDAGTLRIDHLLDAGFNQGGVL